MKFIIILLMFFPGFSISENRTINSAEPRKRDYIVSHVVFINKEIFNVNQPEIDNSFKTLLSSIYTMYLRQVRRYPDDKGVVKISLSVSEEGKVIKTTLLETDLKNNNFLSKITSRVKLHKFESQKSEEWEGEVHIFFNKETNK